MLQGGVDAIGDFEFAQGNKVHLIRRNGDRPDQAFVVVMFFGHAGQQAPGPDAVRPHHDGLLRPIGREESRIDGGGIARAQFEDVAHFDTARSVERLSAVNAGIAITCRREISNQRRRVVAAYIRVEQVITRLVRARDEIGR